MSDSRSASEKETRPVEPSQEAGDGFRADLPLAVLESIRQHDRPAEVLEDEDLAASLPRRLGLTGVVESQIQRYQLARKRRERISSEDVANLLRLVMRRPDSEPILREAGQALAKDHGREPLYRMATAARLLPQALSSRIAKRSVRRLLNRFGGGSPVRVTRRPFRVEMRDPVTARLGSTGSACVLYAAAIEESVQHATGRRPNIVHVECRSNGAERCAWEIG